MCWRLGAGRARKEDPVQAGAGVELHAKPGDTVRAGQPLLTLHTDTPEAPWTVIKSNDKKRARLGAMRHVLASVDYDGKDLDVVGTPDPNIVLRAADLFEDEGEEQAAAS